MKLYTKTGDDGQTGLAGGTRVSKDNLRVVAYGEVDATNAALGSAIMACDDEDTKTLLLRIQSDLFSLGGELATSKDETPQVMVEAGQVAQLERWIDKATAETQPLKQFVLPGGTELAARLHLARTTCRAAERSTVTLSQQQPVNREALVYLNRLSDLLFALARAANHRAGVPDIPWSAPKKSPRGAGSP